MVNNNEKERKGVGNIMEKMKKYSKRVFSLFLAFLMVLTGINFPQASPQLSQNIPFEYGSGAITSLSASTVGYSYGFQYSPERNATGGLHNAYLIENREKDSSKYLNFKNAGYYIGADKKNHAVDMRMYLWDYQESDASDDDRSHSFIWIDDNGHVRINSCSADGTYKGSTAEHYHELSNSTNGGVYMEYHFYDAVTKAEVNFNGVITYKDIDGTQGTDTGIVNEGISIDGGEAEVILTDSTVIQQTERNGKTWYQGSMYTENIIGSDGHTQDDQKITLKFKCTSGNPLRVIYRNNTVNEKLISDYQHIIDNETVSITYKIPDKNLPTASTSMTAKELIENAGGEVQRYLNYGTDTSSENAQNILNMQATKVDGYVFDGWYTSDDFTESSKWSGTNMLTGNLILYGRYIADKYHITVKGKIEGNSSMKELCEPIEFSYGDKIEVKTYGLTSTDNNKTYELQYATVDGKVYNKNELHPAGSDKLNHFYDKINHDVEIVYVYKLVDKTGWVKVEHYIDGTDQKIENGKYDETYYGPVGENAYVAPISLEGWQVVSANINGTISTSDLTSIQQKYSASGVTVKFYYKAVSGGLTVRYVYDGEPEVQVTTNSVYNGELNQQVNADQMRISKEQSDAGAFEGLQFLGMKVRNTDGTSSIVAPSDQRYAVNVTLTGSPQTITFVYKTKETAIVVRHISKDECDGGNKVLKEENPVYKSIGSVFVAKSDAFKGYDLIGDSGNTVYTATAADNGATIYIDYYYQHETHKLTTRYRDNKGNQFVYKSPVSDGPEYTDVVTSNIHYGQEWTAPQKDAWGYSISPDSEKTGTMGESDVEVVYVYEPKPATVIVRHIDDNGRELIANKEYHNWKFNDEYTVTADGDLTEAEEITLGEYSHISTSESVTGRINTFDGNGVITVDFLYTKAPARVVINHVLINDDESREILKQETITGNSGDAWTSKPWDEADASGYVLTHTPEPSSGIMQAGTLVLEYTYIRKTGTMEIQYLTRDASGNLVEFGLSSYSTDVTFGQHVQTTPKTYPDYAQALGYTVESVQGTNTTGWQTLTSNGQVTGYNGVINANKTTIRYIYVIDKVKVTTKYKQQSGEDISGPDAAKAKDWVQTYNAFSAYTTHNDTDHTPPEFYGYEWSGRHPWNSYGTLGNEDIEVTYQYYKKNANLRVNYVDEAGNPLKESKDVTGFVFDEYNEKPANITGYEYKELKKGSAPEKGTLSEEDTVITFVYERASASVIVRYIDTENNVLADHDTLNGNFGNAFNASPKDISGWTLISVQATGNVEVNDNTKLVSGHFGTTTQTIKFIYTKTATKIIVNHIDEETGNSIHNPETINGVVGDTYEAKPIDLLGYSYKGPASFSAPTEGTMQDGVTVITLMYSRNEATVTVHFVNVADNEEILVDKNDKKVQNPIVINGKFKDPYETEAADIYGWEVVREPANKSGVMIDGNIDVTYMYRKKSQTVTYKYIDIDDGHSVSETEIIMGETGDKYESKVKDYDAEPEKYPELYGYVLVETPEDSGTIGEEDIVIEYKYQKKTRSITVLYIDQETGEEVAPADTLADLVVGSWYNTTAKTVFGYTLVGTEGAEPKGYVTEKPITIKYIYKRLTGTVKVRYVNESMQDIAESVTIVAQIGDNYETQAKDIVGYQLVSIPANWSGKVLNNTYVTYVYKVATTTVTTRYINADETDEVKRFLISNTVETYPFGSEYTTEAKEFSGMKLIETPSNATGVANNPNGTVVDYYYSAMESSVTARYLDMDGKQISVPVVQTGNIGDEYQTSRKDIQGYEFDHVDGETTGKFKEGNTIVAYYYNAIPAKVVVNYVDENSIPIADEITLTGKVGDAYDTEQKTIEGYDFKFVSGNASGSMTEDIIYVVYHYGTKKVALTVNHINEQGDKIADSDYLTLKKGDSYQTEAKEIYGYELSEIPDNASGKIEEDLTISYKYSKKDSTVIVRYVDDESEEDIATSDILEGKVFDEYHTEAKEVKGYTLIKDAENKDGEFIEETITVIYRYTKDGNTDEPIEDTNIIVRYIDENGDDIIPAEELKKENGEKYVIEPKEIEGYELTEIPENASGTITNPDEVIEIIFHYKKSEAKQNAKVIVKYLDVDKNEISESITIEDKAGTPYTTQAKEIQGYKLTKTPENQSGIMNGEIIVEYIYEKAVTTGTVTIHYKDSDGNTIAPDKVITGNVGDKFTIDAVEIEGFVPKEIPEGGVFAEKPIELTITYTKKETEKDMVTILVKYLDEKRNVIAVSTTITGKAGDKYTAKPKEITGYELVNTPDNATGIFAEGIEVVFTYKAVKKDAKVIVKYVDEKGKEISSQTSVIGKEGDKYEVKSKSINGYKLKKTSGNEKGVMKGTITVTFTYEKTKTKKSALTVDKKASDQNNKTITSAKAGDTIKYAITVSATGADAKNVVIKDKFNTATAVTATTVTGSGSYIIDMSNKTFHSEDCKHLNDISASSKRKTTRSYSILTKLGYKPATDCSPKDKTAVASSAVAIVPKADIKSVKAVGSDGKEIKLKNVELADNGELTITISKVKVKNKVTITYSVALDKKLSNQKLTNNVTVNADNTSKKTDKATIEITDKNSSSGNNNNSNSSSNNNNNNNTNSTTKKSAGQTTNGGKQTVEGVQTSDTFSLIFVIAVAAILATGVALIFLKKKKNN